MIRISAFLSLLGMLPALLMAGSLELKHVPADVKMVVHFDAEQFQGGALGTFLLKQLGTMDEALIAIDTFAKDFGFDPRKDIHGVTMFADTVEEGGGGVLIHGAFDRDTLMSKALDNPTYESFAHGTADVHTFVENRKKTYTYMAPGNKLIAMSERKEQILRVIDTLRGEAKTLEASNLHKVPVPKGGEFLFIGGGGFDTMKGLRAQAAVLKQARTMHVAMHEADGQISGRMDLLAEDAETAELMLEVMDGLVAFARDRSKKDADAVSLLKPLTSSVKGETLSMQFQHKSDELVALMQKRVDAERKKAEPRGD